METGLEHKFCRPEVGLQLTEDSAGFVIEGYASLFDAPDQGGDTVARGAYARSLKAMAAEGRRVLVAAGAIEGLSIGYRTVRARKADTGQRILTELDLWEVSLVTFPMLAQARVRATDGGGADEDAALAETLASTFRAARDMLA